METGTSAGMTIPSGTNTSGMTIPSGANPNGMPNPIIEDDQPLYDWGIENRLDQYYQDDQNGENYGPSQPYYTQSRDYSSGPPGREYPSSPPGRDYRTPPPAHQELARVPGQYRQERQNQNTEIKEEPGLDMSQWSHPGYQGFYHRKLPPPSPGSFPAFSLDTNEALKVERKRARNRVAASKCRMRKIEKIQTLDHQTSELKSENDELAGLAAKLKEQVYKLQQELQWHINNGCQVSERASKAAELIAETGKSSSSSVLTSKPVLPTPQIASPDSTTAPPIETPGLAQGVAG